MPVSWLPMLIIALAQIQMAFNVSALIMSMGSIVDDFDTSPTVVGSGLVVYSLFVAAFVMLGAKLAAIAGARRMFMAGVLIHGLTMGLMAVSTGPAMMLFAQAAAGLAAAALVPVLVVMIAVHYRGAQQEQALGPLGAAQAIAGVMAFLIVGLMSVLVGWRWSFGMLVGLGALNLLLSTRLKPVAREPDVQIDWVGAFLAAAAVMLVSLGFNGINSWGLLVAKADAPVDIQGFSPALFLIVFGVMFGQAFFVWLRRRREAGKSQLFALEVLDTREERAATFSLLIIAALGPAVNFLIPLYIQIVQGRSSLQTAVAMIPYSLAIFASATFVVRLYGRLAPRRIGQVGFLVTAVGLVFLAYVIQNDWGTPLVILGLVIVGLGEGALLTLFFNVLVSASPKRLAGHVGALRGTVNNLATGLGTALAGALAVALLASLIVASIESNPTIPPSLIRQLDLDNVDFLTNEQVEDALEETTATPSQIEEAQRINEDTRLEALKVSFLFLAAVSLLAVVPASGVPPYRPGEIPSEHLAGIAEDGDDFDEDTQTDSGTIPVLSDRALQGKGHSP